MISLNSLIDLHASFLTDLTCKVGSTVITISRLGNTLLHYLAQPRIFVSSFNFHEAVRVLKERQHPDRLDAIGVVPQDVNIFKKRAVLLANNNDAYRIAVKENPSVEDLIEFSYIMHGWSLLYPIKVYLMHHMDIAMKYTGLLPYGSPVVAFVNSLDSKPMVIPVNPDYADHIYLKDISNREAMTFNMPSVEINNIMYLRGLKIVSKAKSFADKPATNKIEVKEED